MEQLVNDGIRTKISMIGEESQEKLQDTMQKIVNDSTGGMVCIIIQACWRQYGRCDINSRTLFGNARLFISAA